MRTILGIVAGSIGAFATIALVEMIAHQIWPPPLGVDWANKESAAAAVKAMPIGALVAVIGSWVAGAFLGTWIACRGAKRRWPAFIVGGLVLIGTVANLAMIPHPAWFVLVSLVAIPTSAYLGSLGARRSVTPV